MTTRQKDTPEELVTYLVQRSGQPDFQMQVPAAWKLTFGAVNPGAPDAQGGYRDRSLHCLRVYEGEKVRAVFCDVRGFRDMSIKFARKIEVESGSATWARDDAGNYEASEKRQLEARFEAEELSPF
jgi:hypothetical protein